MDILRSVYGIDDNRSFSMSDHNWCHGPKCHKSHTQDRIRGVKGSKVLRTRKIKQDSWNANSYFSHFCSQGCWNDFAYAHWEEFIALHPRTEALETPILDPKKEVHHNAHYGNYSWTETKIKVDNTRTNDIG